MKPLFIVIEGIDGTGKAVQAAMLAAWLFRTNKRVNVFLTREPTGISPASHKLRELLAKKGSEKKYRKRFLKLFVQDRKFHISRIIRPALKSGAIVISERYKHSTFAYQMAQGIPFEEIEKLHQGMPVPDLTVILDLEPEESLKRTASDGNRQARESFEKTEFLKKVRDNYLGLPGKFSGEKIVVIPANGSADEVFEKVKNEISRIL